MTWTKCWIFDLDNTLHNATPHIFPHINRAIADLFDDVFSIEQARYRPKPDSYGFLRLCRANHLRPQRCIMVEDTAII